MKTLLIPLTAALRLAAFLFVTAAVLTVGGAAEDSPGDQRRYSLDGYLTKHVPKAAVPVPSQSYPATGGGLVSPGFSRFDSPKTNANTAASPWAYWLNRSAGTTAGATNRVAGSQNEPNDCEVCKNLPRPRKCCGVCGRVNDCELCLTGEHALPGGLKLEGAGGKRSAWTVSGNPNCPSGPRCGLNRGLPRTCCGYCNSAYECLFCVLGQHTPTGKPNSKPIFTTWRPNGPGGGLFLPPIRCNTHCYELPEPHGCCAYCMQPYQCKLCAASLHEPGGHGRIYDDKGFMLVSNGGRPGETKWVDTKDVVRRLAAFNAIPANAVQPNGARTDGVQMLWDLEQQLKYVPRAAPSRP